MPDQSEVTLPQTRVFGRSDLIRYLKPENAKEVSRAHFTIVQEGGAFYLQDGGPDPQNLQAWKPSINRTSVNGLLLEPGGKRKLNTNDVIDVSQLGLNLTFKTR
jgi:predicted component of type VI protein secretion system